MKWHTSRKRQKVSADCGFKACSTKLQKIRRALGFRGPQDGQAAALNVKVHRTSGFTLTSSERRYESTDAGIVTLPRRDTLVDGESRSSLIAPAVDKQATHRQQASTSAEQEWVPRDKDQRKNDIRPGLLCGKPKSSEIQGDLEQASMSSHSKAQFQQSIQDRTTCGQAKSPVDQQGSGRAKTHSRDVVRSDQVIRRKPPSRRTDPRFVQRNFPQLTQLIPVTPYPQLELETRLDELIWAAEPSEKECAVCREPKEPLEFPTKPPTEECTHTVQTCAECVSMWIESELESKGWQQISCPFPNCSSLLTYEDVKRDASESTFKRYDKFVTHNALGKLGDFYWCLQAGCESGQLHEGGSNLMGCVSCEFRQCIRHKQQWHQDETCQQYDCRIADGEARKAEKRSERFIRSNAKQCPNKSCGWWIMKLDGCDHMKCMFQSDWGPNGRE